jgi:hypothetical protein
MSKDAGLELHFTSDEREKIEYNLRDVIQVLWAASCVEVEVPDYDIGRALVSGDSSLLKIAIDTRTKQWGIGNLKSNTVQFQIVDFSRLRPPEIVLREAMSEIPNIVNVNSTLQGYDFSDFYPGKIIAIIGAETIPKGVNADALVTMARRAPLVIIAREGDVDSKRMNESAWKLFAEYIDFPSKAL